jgi:hypothetical protein
MKRIEVGDIIYGFAGGHFGRDSYEDKTCIHTGFYNGTRYAVFSGAGRFGGFSVLYGDDLAHLERDDYTTPEPDEF